MINGALGIKTSELGYNLEFWYPVEGGIAELPNAFVKDNTEIFLNTQIEQINTKQKIVHFKNGKTTKYDNLISTIPLPELLCLLNETPERIISNAKLLEYSSVLTINLGISKPGITTKHWVYFPEKKFDFYRLSFPMNFSPKMCPKGNSSLSAEISYKKGCNVDTAKMYTSAVEHLVNLGMIDSEKDIIVRDVVNSKYSYVTFDKFRQKNLPDMHDYLNSNDIYSIGRYGSWNYYSIEETILEAYELSKKLMKK
jgi:protoporphyrinogen oxidase